MPVLGARNLETPTTSIRLRIAAGQRHESVEALGLAALTASMMNEAHHAVDQRGVERPPAETRLERFLRRQQRGNPSPRLRSLTRNLDETLAILAEKLLQPKFAADDFARVQAQTLQAIEQSKTQAATTAQVVYQLVLFGRDNPFAYLDRGTSETVAALTVEGRQGLPRRALLAHHREHRRRQRSRRRRAAPETRRARRGGKGRMWRPPR